MEAKQRFTPIEKVESLRKESHDRPEVLILSANGGDKFVRPLRLANPVRRSQRAASGWVRID
jgi:hypothetical protein